MSTRALHLHVDRLVLDPALGRVDRAALTAALQAELTRRLSEVGERDGPFDRLARRGSRRVPRLEGTPFKWSEGAGTESLARHLADSILGGITPCEPTVRARPLAGPATPGPP